MTQPLRLLPGGVPLEVVRGEPFAVVASFVDAAGDPLPLTGTFAAELLDRDAVPLAGGAMAVDATGAATGVLRVEASAAASALLVDSLHRWRLRDVSSDHTVLDGLVRPRPSGAAGVAAASFEVTAQVAMGEAVVTVSVMTTGSSGSGGGTGILPEGWGLGAREPLALVWDGLPYIATLGAEGSWKAGQVREIDGVRYDPATTTFVCAYSGRDADGQITRVGLSISSDPSVSWNDDGDPIAENMEDPFIVVDAYTGLVWRDDDGRAYIYGENKLGPTQLGIRLIRTLPNSWDIDEDFGQVIDPGAFGLDETDVDSPAVRHLEGLLVGLFEVRTAGAADVYLCRGTAPASDPTDWTCDPVPLLDLGAAGTLTELDVVPDDWFIQGRTTTLTVHGQDGDGNYYGLRYQTTDLPADWGPGSFTELPGNPLDATTETIMGYLGDAYKVTRSSYENGQHVEGCTVLPVSAMSLDQRLRWIESESFAYRVGYIEDQLGPTIARVAALELALGPGDEAGIEFAYGASLERIAATGPQPYETESSDLDPFLVGLGYTVLPGSALDVIREGAGFSAAVPGGIGTDEVARFEVRPHPGSTQFDIGMGPTDFTVYGVAVSTVATTGGGSAFVIGGADGELRDGSFHLGGAEADLGAMFGHPGKAVGLYGSSPTAIAKLDTPVTGADILDLRVVVFLLGNEQHFAVEFLYEPISPPASGGGGVSEEDAQALADAAQALAEATAAGYTDAQLASFAASLSGAVIYRGAIDCSTNPNYPTAVKGDLYRVSVAGRIGGVAGPRVEVGDSITCNTDTGAGSHAGVGSAWDITQGNIDGAVIGPSSAVTDSRFALFDGTTGRLLKQATVSPADLLPRSAVSSFAETLLDDTSAAAMIATLGLDDPPFDMVADHWMLLSRQVGVGYSAVNPSASAANSNNQAVYLPFRLKRRIGVSGLAVYCQTANAGVSAVVRLGLHHSSAGRPGAVLVDAGTESINAAGMKSRTFSELFLDPGCYFAVAPTQGLDTAGTNPALGGCSSTSAACSEPTPTASNNHLPYLQATVAGALADNPAVAVSRGVQAKAYHIWLKVSTP